MSREAVSTVTVYSKPDCHLCEQAMSELRALQAELGFEYLTIFPHFPGMTRRDTLAQLES